MERFREIDVPDTAARHFANTLHNITYRVQDGYERLGKGVRESTGLKLISDEGGAVNGVRIKVQGEWKPISVEQIQHRVIGSTERESQIIARSPQETRNNRAFSNIERPCKELHLADLLGIRGPEEQFFIYYLGQRLYERGTAAEEKLSRYNEALMDMIPTPVLRIPPVDFLRKKAEEERDMGLDTLSFFKKNVADYLRVFQLGEDGTKRAQTLMSAADDLIDCQFHPIRSYLFPLLRELVAPSDFDRVDKWASRWREELGTKPIHFKPKRRLSRRTLLGLGIGAVLAVGLGESYLVKNILRTPNDIDDETMANLRKLAGELANQIKFKGFDESLRIEERIIKATPNQEIIAQVLLLQAYLEAGLDGVKQVRDFIQYRGLEVLDEEDKLYSQVYVLLSPDITEPAKLFIPTGALEMYFRQLPNPTNEYSFWHNLYLIGQYARQPEDYRLNGLVKVADSTIDTGAFLAVDLFFMHYLDRFYYLVGHMTDKDLPVPNPFSNDILRKLLQLGSAYVPAKLIGSGVGSHLTSKGQEAMFRYNPFTTRHPALNQFRGKLFSFEEVEDNI